MGLPVIQALWVGNSLSVIEQLALASYKYHGHQFHLYTYGYVDNIPDGIVIKNANAIIPESEIFRHKGNSDGSLAPFSDWFRWKLLYEKGGFWVDMDMVCLQPLAINKERVFGWQEENVCNISLLGFPPHDIMIKSMLDLADSPVSFAPWDSFREKRKKIRRRLKGKSHRCYVSWGEVGPFGFTKAIKYYDCLDLALPVQYSYPVPPEKWFSVFDDSYERGLINLEGAYTIHLWNEAMRQIPSFNKNSNFYSSSLIEVLKRKYL